jgi:hypothetical protein
MDWIVEALHQSHTDEKRFREDAITRLQEEQSKIQNRLDRLYDRLDGFIEPDFFERKSREWRQTQKRLADQITEYQEAANDYVQDGIRLLELSKKAYFLYKQQDSSEKRKLLNFVCSNSIWKDHTLTATFRQPFDLLAITNTTWQREKAAGADPATSVLSGSAGRRLVPIKNVVPFSRFFNFARDFIHLAFYIVCTIFSLNTQLCLSCDRHFMTHIRQKAFGD